MKYQRRMERWQRRGAHRGAPHAFLGLMLLFIGVLFLLNNLGFFYLEDVRKYWPALLIAAGTWHAIFARHNGRRLILGAMLIVMGGLLLAQNFGYIHGQAREIVFPVILIFAGISFLFRARSGNPGFAGAQPWPTGPSSLNPNVLNEVAVFGGIQRRVDTQDFEGGELSAVFGGIELDLRGANTKKDEIVIEANAVFGGIELRLPDRWRITVRGSGIFGGYEDCTHPPTGGADEKRPHLIVAGSAVLGGVSVRN